MTSGWIPAWAATAWTVVFEVVLVVHVRHAFALSGRARAWHVTHIVMALGMIDMFWLLPSMPVGAGFGRIVFALGAVLTLGWGIFDRIHDGRPLLLWLIAATDLASMVYMFSMSTTRIQVLTLLLVVWFVLEAAGWASGAMFALLRAPAEAQEAASSATRQPVPTRAEAAATVIIQADRQSQGRLAKHSEHMRDLRITLALMSLGMAYMFLAMQYGMGATTPMSRMDNGQQSLVQITTWQSPAGWWALRCSSVPIRRCRGRRGLQYR